MISVIMAIKNEMPHLRPAVESILGQTMRDFEFIIVDDSSTDGSAEYLRSLADPRVRVLSNAGTGQTAGLNQALRAAKFDLIARMDGDDWCYPERFEKQIEAIEKNPNAALVSSDYLICDERMEPIAPVHLDSRRPERVFHYMATKNNPFCHPTIMFRRQQALEAGGYDEALRNAQDINLWRRLLSKGTWQHVPLVLVKYRVRRQSLSVLRHPEQEKERRMIFSNTITTITSAPATATARLIEGMYAYKLGFAAWLAGRRRYVGEYAGKSLLRGVRPVRSISLLLTSVLPRALYLKLCGYSGIYR